MKPLNVIKKTRYTNVSHDISRVSRWEVCGVPRTESLRSYVRLDQDFDLKYYKGVIKNKHVKKELPK